MAKLSDKDRITVLKDYAAGNSVREIAKKFNVSPTAISKILGKVKSLQNGNEVDKKLTRQNNAEIAQIVIDEAMRNLERRIGSASVADSLKVIERLMLLYGNNTDEKSALDKIVNAIDRLTGGEDE